MRSWFTDGLGRNTLEVIPNANYPVDRDGNPINPPRPTPPVPPKPPSSAPAPLPVPAPTGPVKSSGTSSTSRISTVGWPWPLPPFPHPPQIPSWPPAGPVPAPPPAPVPPNPPAPPGPITPPGPGPHPVPIPSFPEVSHQEPIPYNPFDPDQDVTLLPIMTKTPKAVGEAQWALYALTPATRVRVSAILPIAKEIVDTTITAWNTGRPDLRGTASGVSQDNQTQFGTPIAFEGEPNEPIQ